jgi:hypothetical protein
VLLGLGLAALALRAPNDGGQPPTPAPSLEASLAGTSPYAIIRPPTYALDGLRLRDDEPVIDVSAGGKHRAYLVRALSGEPRVHVVNDWLAGTPVSVVHCDRSHCTRVFTEPGGKGPLPLAFGGWHRGQLMIRDWKAFYSQSTLRPANPRRGPFPHPELKFVHTTWGAWRAAHPDTDVYLGAEPTRQQPENKGQKSEVKELGAGKQ